MTIGASTPLPETPTTDQRVDHARQITPQRGRGTDIQHGPGRPGRRR